MSEHREEERMTLPGQVRWVGSGKKKKIHRARETTNWLGTQSALS